MKLHILVVKEMLLIMSLLGVVLFLLNLEVKV